MPKRINEIKNHIKHAIKQACFCFKENNMKTIVSGLLVLLLSVLQAQEKPELVITTGHILSVKSCAFHPKGRFMATGSDDNSIKIWDRALKQEFRTLTGHTSGVRQVAYTHDGEYLVSMDDAGNLMFWNALKGEKQFHLKLEVANDPFSVSPTANKVLVRHEDTLRLLEVPSGKLLKKVYFRSPSKVQLLSDNSRFIATRDGRGLVICSLDDTETPLVEVKDETVIFQETIAVNETENMAAIMTFKELRLIDLTKKSTKVVVPFEAGELVNTFMFSPDGKKLLISTSKNRLKIISTQDGKVLRTIEDLIKPPSGLNYTLFFGIAGLDVSSDGNLVAFNGTLIEMNNGRNTNSYTTLIYDVNTGKSKGRLQGNFKMIRDMSLTPDNKYLCTRVIGGEDPGLRFWNLKDGSIVKNIPAYESSFTKSGKACYWYPPDSLVIFNTTDFSLEKKLKLKNVIKTSLSDDGKYLLALTVNTLTPGKDELLVYETNSYKQTLKTTVDHHTFYPEARFSPDGAYVIGVGRYQLEVLETMGGKSVKQMRTDKEFSRLLTFVPGTTQAIVAQDKFVKDAENTVYVVDYKTGELKEEVNVFALNYINSGAFSPDGKTLALGTGHSFGEDYDVILFDWESKTLKCRLKGHINAINQVAWHTDGHTVYSSSLDGTAKIWDVATCSMKGSLVCMAGAEEYIIYSPEYYYKCSKGNYDGICFRYKNKLYRFDQFDLQLNRPDLVMEKLGTSKLLVSMYRQAWKKRVKRMGFTEEALNGSYSLPEVEIENRENLVQAGGKVKFKLTAQDSDSPINRVNVYVNNIPVYGLKGLDVSTTKSNKLNKEVEVLLSAGQNLIEVSVVNAKGLESTRESFTVENPVAKPKPNLYILVIAAARFEASKHNLTFPVKDGRDFVNQMKSGTQFGKIEVSFLQDSMVTVENIRAAGKLYETARPDDQVIVYVSSHGLLDNNLDYYIATHNVDFEAPAAKGLPYEEIEGLFNTVQARNRLILIDACHSGEVDKEGVDVVSTNANPDAAKVTAKAGGLAIKPKAGLKNSFAYMQVLFSDVSKGSGATVISAAGGNEFALESKEWNNGVFTYSLLKGLQNNEADLDKDKQIRIAELKSYVIDKVSELTGGRQTPTARKENEVNNFIIYRK